MKKKIIKTLLIIIFLILVFNVVKVNAIVDVNKINHDIENKFVIYEEPIIIFVIIKYICNLGFVIAVLEPIVLFLITFIKKYDWKIFKRTLILSIVLFVFCTIWKIATGGIGQSITGNSQGDNFIEDIIIFGIIIILELITIIYPIIAIKKQISLKGEEKNVKDDKTNN